MQTSTTEKSFSPSPRFGERWSDEKDGNPISNAIRETVLPLAPFSGRWGRGVRGKTCPLPKILLRFQHALPLIPSPSPRTTGEKGARIHSLVWTDIAIDPGQIANCHVKNNSIDTEGASHRNKKLKIEIDSSRHILVVKGTCLTND